MRAPKRQLGTLNRLPRHLVNSKIVESLNNNNLARWAGVSRGMRRNTRAQLAVRRDDKEQEVTDAARAIWFAYKMANKQKWGPHIFKEVIDRLPKSQFDVRESRVTAYDIPDMTYLDYSGYMYTPHFSFTINFTNIFTEDAGVTLQHAGFFVTSRRRGYTSKNTPIPGLHVSSSNGPTGRSTVVREAGFPAQWAKGVEQMLGRRRSPRHHRV